MKRRTKIIIKRILFMFLISILSVVAVIIYANWVVPRDSKDFVYDNVDSIPIQKVALVLGTSSRIGRKPNLYFTYRIQAAKELYKAGKVSYFVLSGDNRHNSYNEPKDMRKALIAVGVPDSIIYLDYAGFRTLDSVVRMKEVFRQDSFIIVSQRFHNERAVYIAQSYGLMTYGYNAKDLNLNKYSVKTKLREKLARVKVLVDIVTNKKPKFLGEPIHIGNKI